MGLLDRYGVNGEEQPREENAFAQRGGEADRKSTRLNSSHSK